VEWEIRESASGGRCILSYFLRDQLYPGIRDRTAVAGQSADRCSERASFREKICLQGAVHLKMFQQGFTPGVETKNKGGVSCGRAPCPK